MLKAVDLSSFLGTTIVFCSLLTNPVKAHAEKVCSNATLQGKYIFNYQGYSGSRENTKRFAVAGWEIYNGDGTLKGVSSKTMEGQPLAQFVPYTGTYKVNPNCIQTEIDIDQNGQATHFNNFFGPTANNISFLVTDPSIFASGIEIRQSAEQ